MPVVEVAVMYLWLKGNARKTTFVERQFNKLRRAVSCTAVRQRAGVKHIGQKITLAIKTKNSSTGAIKVTKVRWDISVKAYGSLKKNKWDQVGNRDHQPKIPSTKGTFVGINDHTVQETVNHSIFVACNNTLNARSVEINSILEIGGWYTKAKK